MSPDEKETLLGMLRTLLADLHAIQQRGAGYFDCDSFISRYNKLLEVSREILPGSRLLATFSPLPELRSVDPADKIKMMQKVLIEGDQLSSLIEAQFPPAQA